MTTPLTQIRSQLAPLGTPAGGFYTIREAAAMTKTGEETIRRAIREGRIPAFGERGRLRVRLADILPQYVPKRKAARDGRT
jgi:excisionase family DNA binding protein